MHLEISGWRLWDQSRAVDNARAASIERTRARNERLEANAFVAQILAARDDHTQSA